jgi:hypothetical protein
MSARPLLALFTLLMLPAAYADCPMEKVQIGGIVQSGEQPVADAQIQVIWDEQRTSDVSSSTRSAADGSFELTLNIDSFGGRTLMAKEKCGYMPDEVEIRVLHDEYREFKREYEFADLGEPINIDLRAR